MDPEYEPLTPETLTKRLGVLDIVRKTVGDNPDDWKVDEVGDGNLNLVFIVEGNNGSVIVKQALPYLRLVGESWPLPLKRSFFEYHALTRQAQRDPGSVPEVLHFNETQALIIMERLHPHIILRHQFIAGEKVAGLGNTMGRFTARTAFRGSDLSMKTEDKKADVALFAGNVELCDITENLVFTHPYMNAEGNRHTSPQLDDVVSQIRSDEALKIEVQHLKRAFTAKTETMCHGDLHAGSIMVTADETRMIDPEFVLYGPLGFDLGMLIANYLMAYHSMRAHINDETARSEYQDWLLEVIAQTWTAFTDEFSSLWRTERTGILYPKALYEDQGHNMASEAALQQLIGEIFSDMLGFAGIEMHRRILGLAHVAELDQIEDADLRAACESICIKFGQALVLNRNNIAGMDSLLAMAKQMEYP